MGWDKKMGLLKKTFFILAIIFLLISISNSVFADKLSINGQQGNVTVREDDEIKLEGFGETKANNNGFLKRDGLIIINDTTEDFTLDQDFLEVGNYTFFLDQDVSDNENATLELVVERGFANQSITAFLVVGLTLLFFTGLVVVGLFASKPLWLKSLMFTLLNLMFVIVLRFNALFVEFSLPDSTLVDSLNLYYGWSVALLPWTLLFGVLVTLLLALSALLSFTGEERDFSKELEGFNKK